MQHRNLGEGQPRITATLRNEPVQARSTARLTRLLDAAAEVIDEIGYERLTTAMVAERAGASIGTVYRYFPDRIAILTSLSARTADEYIDAVSRELRGAGHATWWDAVSASIDLTARSFATKKGFRSLRFGDVIDLRPAESETTNNAVIAAAMAQALSERFALTSDALALHLEVAVEIVDALLARAFAIDPKGDRRFIDGAKSIAQNYLVEKLGEPV